MSSMVNLRPPPCRIVRPRLTPTGQEVWTETMLTTQLGLTFELPCEDLSLFHPSPSDSLDNMSPQGCATAHGGFLEFSG